MSDQPTLKARILALLKTTTTPLDDDEIAERLGVYPRQTVNRMCREFADTGEIERVNEAGFKIVEPATWVLEGAFEPGDRARAGRSSLHAP